MNILRFSVGSEAKKGWLFDVSLLLGSYAGLITVIIIIGNFSYDDWFISLMWIGPRPPRKHRIREAPNCFDYIGVCI